jgi:hypothetical protein
MEPKPAHELTEAQIETIGQINDLANDHPDEDFHQIIRRVAHSFINDPNFEQFLVACRGVFERERESADDLPQPEQGGLFVPVVNL